MTAGTCTRTDPHRCVLGVHIAAPRCLHCGSPSVIDQDGERLVCRPCLWALGRIAGDPGSVHPREVERLAHFHVEVVSLIEDRDRDGIPTPAWRWTGSWPQVGEGVQRRETQR